MFSIMDLVFESSFTNHFDFSELSKTEQMQKKIGDNKHTVGNLDIFVFWFYLIILIII